MGDRPSRLLVLNCESLGKSFDSLFSFSPKWHFEKRKKEKCSGAPQYVLIKLPNLVPSTLHSLFGVNCARFLMLTRVGRLYNVSMSCFSATSGLSFLPIPSVPPPHRLCRPRPHNTVRLPQSQSRQSACKIAATVCEYPYPNTFTSVVEE